jgi:putative ABC transport system permease protein
MLRATLKNLLSRKLRLLLSGLAVILGVMFVSGAFVLTDTLGRSFEALFATAYSDVDVNVQGRITAPAGDGGPEVRAGVPESVVTQVERVPGVARAQGSVFADGLGVVDPRTRKVIAGFGQHFGANWTGRTDLVVLREGRAPSSDTEAVVNANLASSIGIHPGDTVSVKSQLQPKVTSYTVVGVFGYSGGRDSLAGETTVAFTTPVAQRLMLGRPGEFNSINATAASGVSAQHLRDRIRAAVGGDYEVQTGEQLAAQRTDQVKQSLSFLNYIFLGFAGVALLVGIFLILNTFSIIVAQRTRELALMRALGASRRQVIGSVITEAVVIGLLAAVVGLGLGVGVGALLAWVFGHLGGSSLALAGVGVPASAVIAAFAVGVGITVFAALFPALRAARVPPVAAMGDIATPDRPLTRLTVSGAGLLALGGGALAVGLTGRAHGATLWTIIAGLVVTLVAVALLTPLISRPVVSLLGRALAWRMPGELGRRNSARNPRRTAITAAALMVGVALVTAISTVYTSVGQSIASSVETGLQAQLVVAGQQTSAQLPTFDPAALQSMRRVDGVAAVVGLWADGAQVDGARGYVTATDDLPALADLTRTVTTAGSLSALTADQAVVDDRTAADRRLSPGSTIRVTTARGGSASYRVVGVYERSSLMRGIVLPAAAAAGFRTAGPTQALVQVRDGADVTTVKSAIDTILADNPDVTVQDTSSFVKQQTSLINTVLGFVQILLLLAMLIAVLGVVNTLVLSVIERTREIGLLRAIGLRRGQTAAMVTVESVVISVFGALLGVAVGAGLGASVVRALQDQGLSTLAFPWRQMVVYVVGAAVVGVVAAIIPAVRAARLNVLGAIAYE